MTISHIPRRSFFAIALFSAVIIVPQVIYAQTFEGEITMQMSSPMSGPQKIDVVYAVKGSKVLQTGDDPKQGKIDIYTDTKTGTQIIVQEAQKKGIEIDQAMIDSAMKSMKVPVIVPKPTGTKEKIAGYNCELFTMMIDSSQEMDLWLTKDFPKIIAEGIRNCTEAGMKSSGIRSDAVLALFDNGYAQVKLELKQGGVTQFANIFVKAEQKKLKDSVFIIPSDVKVTKYDPSMMGGGGAGGQ